jgi:hypothetical protein
MSSCPQGVILSYSGSVRKRKTPAGRSRMGREAHVRICGGLGGEVPPA